MPKSLKIFGKNKYQFYVSWPLFFAGMGNALRLPHGYEDSLWACGLLVAALFCVVNALCDSKRMHPAERIVAAVWFVFLLCITIALIWQRAGIEVFSDR